MSYFSSLLNRILLLAVPYRINVRIEHVNHSKCRSDFLDRVKNNEDLKREAKQKGLRVVCKRQVCYSYKVLY